VQFPISIELRRSYLLISSVCTLHCAAAVGIILAPLHWHLRLVLLIAVAVSLAATLRPARISSLHLNRDGRLECGLSEGVRVAAPVLSGSTVFPWLVVLRLRPEGARRLVSLPLFADHMSGEEFRILRLWLRWGAISGNGSEPVC